MKNKLFILMLALCLVLPMINAYVYIDQTQSVVGSNALSNRMVITYADKPPVLSFNPSFVNPNNIFYNYVEANRLFEMSIEYSSIIKSWNINNPTRQVDYCNLQIDFGNGGDFLLPPNNSVLNINFTSSMDDSENVYFSQFSSKDILIANFICYFKNNIYSNYQSYAMPIQLSAVVPTIHCKACQLYNWKIQNANTQKANTLRVYTNTNKDYISKFINIVFQIAIYLFWLLMIILVFYAIGLIFWVGYWIYLYLVKMTK